MSSATAAVAAAVESDSIVQFTWNDQDGSTCSELHRVCGASALPMDEEEIDIRNEVRENTTMKEDGDGVATSHTTSAATATATSTITTANAAAAAKASLLSELPAPSLHTIGQMKAMRTCQTTSPPAEEGGENMQYDGSRNVCQQAAEFQALVMAAPPPCIPTIAQWAPRHRRGWPDSLPTTMHDNSTNNYLGDNACVVSAASTAGNIAAISPATLTSPYTQWFAGGGGGGAMAAHSSTSCTGPTDSCANIGDSRCGNGASNNGNIDGGLRSHELQPALIGALNGAAGGMAKASSGGGSGGKFCAASARDWSSISEEIMLLIFQCFRKRKYLIKAARVCRRWRRLAYDPSLWLSINLTDVALRADDFATILARSPRNLSLINSFVTASTSGTSATSTARSTTALKPLPPTGQLLNSSPTTAITVPLQQKKMRVGRKNGAVVAISSRMLSVNLSASRLTDCQVLQILHAAPRLRELDLSSTQVTDESVAQIGVLCPNLRRLCLNMCSGVTGSGIASTLRNLKHLEMLGVGWTQLGGKGVSAIHRYGTCLRELDISGCREDLDDAALKQIVLRCSKLEALDVSDCYKLSDTSINHITEFCKHLHQISLSRCHSITVAAMRVLAGKETLKAINLFGCYAVVFPHIREVCSHLEINKSPLSSIECITSKSKKKNSKK